MNMVNIVSNIYHHQSSYFKVKDISSWNNRGSMATIYGANVFLFTEESIFSEQEAKEKKKRKGGHLGLYVTRLPCQDSASFFFHLCLEPAGLLSLLALTRKDLRNRGGFVVQDQYSLTVGRLESLSSIICHFEMQAILSSLCQCQIT